MWLKMVLYRISHSWFAIVMASSVALDQMPSYAPSDLSLRKHAYSNILKILQPKKENFQIKILVFFHISAQNIDCGYSLEPPRRGGSNEYPQSMILSKIRNIMYTPVNPSFTIQKWGLRGSKSYRYVFVMVYSVCKCPFLMLATWDFIHQRDGKVLLSRTLKSQGVTQKCLIQSCFL